MQEGIGEELPIVPMAGQEDPIHRPRANRQGKHVAIDRDDMAVDREWIGAVERVREKEDDHVDRDQGVVRIGGPSGPDTRPNRQ